jgi:hypothetical protein
MLECKSLYVIVVKHVSTVLRKLNSLSASSMVVGHLK